MEVRRDIVGTAQDPRWRQPVPVHSYVLDTRRGLAATVWTYGATLVEVLVPDRDGAVGNVVLRLPDVAAYEDRARNPYLGATVGRFCRSVAHSRFELDGVVHELTANDGRHHIHGGSTGFDRFVWDAAAEREGDQLVLRCRLESPDGAQGYPGALSAECTYRLEGEGRLLIEYRATTTASTIVSLTNHAFWNLGGEATVDDHLLALNSARAVVFDDELIPLPGAPAPVAGTDLDHRAARRLGGRTLDNCFVLDESGWAAELVHPGSGRTMRVRTDQPGLGVYTADWYRDRPRGGICLEAGALPDAPNRPDYPSARLDPGEEYSHRTSHEFGVR